MNVDKKLSKFNKKFEKATEDCAKEVKVMTLKRKHFKDNLATTRGFGFQDLKEEPKKVISTLMCEGFDLAFTPNGDPTPSSIEIKVTASKR